MPLPTGRKVMIALVTAAAVIAIAGGAAVLSLRGLLDSGRWVSHTHETRSELASVLGGVERAEAAVRASAITGDTAFLVDYRRGVADATAALGRARALTADNPDQKRRLAALARLLAARRQQMSALAAVPAGSAGLADRVRQGRALTGRIAATIDTADSAERRLLAARLAAQAASGDAAQLILVALVLLAVAVAIVAHRSIQRDLAARLRVEQALRASEARVQAVFDQTFQFTWLLTPGGVVVEVNETARAAVDTPREEVVGHRFAELPGWDPDSRPIVESATAEASRGAFVRCEGVLQVPGGSPVVLDISVKLVRGDAGESAMLIAEGRDVTERKAADAALRASEAKFAGILAIAADAIISVDDAQTMVHFNRGAEEIFGYTAADAIGRPLEMLLPERFRAAHGEHTARFARSGESARRMGARREIYGRRKDGQEFPAEASISKLELDGQRLFTVVLRDITDRKRAADRQRFLAEAGELLAGSLDYEQTLERVASVAVPTLADACLVDVYDLDGVQGIAVAHRDPEKQALVAEMRRRAPSRLDDSHPLAVVRRTGTPLLVAEITDELLARATTNDSHRELVRRIGLSSAMFVPLVARGHAIGVLSCYASARRFGEDDLALAGDLARRAALAMDNARLYESARRATGARDALLGVVSHDLRNPLSTISMCSAALLDPEPAPHDSVRSMAQTIRQCAEWMQRIIRDLLDVTSIEAGRLSVDRQPVAPRDLLAATRALLGAQAEEAGLELVAESVATLPQIDADRERILQVLFNLVGNAIKFTDPGGRIVLAAAALGDGRSRRSASGDGTVAAVRFSVRDTGHGIPPEHLPRVFDRFWQAQHARRGGAGLGLAIAKGIVQAHGGELCVESEAGRGTTFFFTIPVASEPAVSAAGGPGTSAPAQRPRKPSA